jgi:hypothetical protein
MRTRLALPILAIVLAACGSSGGSASAVASSIVDGGQPSTAPAAPGDGTTDCERLKTAAQQLISLQLMAQLNTPDIVEQVRDKQFGDLDVDAFLAGMQELHGLDAHASPLGDPKAAIDFYESVGLAAKVLFATQPVTQAAIDTYNESVGTIPDFLGHQIAIGGAMDEAGC